MLIGVPTPLQGTLRTCPEYVQSMGLHRITMGNLASSFRNHYRTGLQRGVLVIIMGSPDLERSNLIGISEKQGTCSRTQGFVEKEKIALDN